MAAVQPAEPDERFVDKWHLLDTLTEAADQLDLSHRTLNVLRAMMTFLPGRLIPDEPGRAMVFASNRSLSARLSGMPESTLRRHLSQLVALGLVSRHNSPNRKRFARRIGSEIKIAFGFDLSPLARHASQLREMADIARQEAEECDVLRAEIHMLRQRIIALGGDTATTEDLRRHLRRKPCLNTLRQLRNDTELLLQDVAPDRSTPTRMDIIDAEIERHIEPETKSISDSETANTEMISLAELTETCQEMNAYFPQPPRSWRDLLLRTEQMAPMMGIDPPVFIDAVKMLGSRGASIAVCYLMERFHEIENPGGYLRRLTQEGRAGRFCENMLVNRLKSGRNCQLTTLKPISAQ